MIGLHDFDQNCFTVFTTRFGPLQDGSSSDEALRFDEANARQFKSGGSQRMRLVHNESPLKENSPRRKNQFSAERQMAGAIDRLLLIHISTSWVNSFCSR